MSPDIKRRVGVGPIPVPSFKVGSKATAGMAQNLEALMLQELPEARTSWHNSTPREPRMVFWQPPYLPAYHRASKTQLHTANDNTWMILIIMTITVRTISMIRMNMTVIAIAVVTMITSILMTLMMVIIAMIAKIMMMIWMIIMLVLLLIILLTLVKVIVVVGVNCSNNGIQALICISGSF